MFCKGVNMNNKSINVSNILKRKINSVYGLSGIVYADTDSIKKCDINIFEGLHCYINKKYLSFIRLSDDRKEVDIKYKQAIACLYFAQDFEIVPDDKIALLCDIINNEYRLAYGRNFERWINNDN